MSGISELFRRKQMMKPTSQPQPIDPPPTPTEEKPRRNGVFINEQDRCFQIIVYQNGEESMAMALGSLEVAKDVIKQKLTEWHHRAQRRPGILVPGNGKTH